MNSSKNLSHDFVSVCRNNPPCGWDATFEAASMSVLYFCGIALVSAEPPQLFESEGTGASSWPHSCHSASLFEFCRLEGVGKVMVYLDVFEISLFVLSG